MNLALMTPAATVQKVIATNLMGAIHVSQAFAPALVRAKGGRIIHFSTIAVPLGLAGEAVYVASKAGVEGFARTFAREVSASASPSTASRRVPSTPTSSPRCRPRPSTASSAARWCSGRARPTTSGTSPPFSSPTRPA
jgi:hypothetical protein